MRRLIRDISSVLILSGLLLVADAGATLVWQEPVTAAIGMVMRSNVNQSHLSYRTAPLSRTDTRALAGIQSLSTRISYLARRERHQVKTGDAKPLTVSGISRPTEPRRRWLTLRPGVSRILFGMRGRGGEGSASPLGARRGADHRFQEASELIASAECLGNANPSAGQCEHGEKNERHQHGPGTFVRVRIMGPAGTEESEVPETKHVERC